MNNYLGEFPVDIENTPFKDFTQSDWALYYIGRYGQTDGAHHKAWVLDQVTRILKGTKVKVTEAIWGLYIDEKTESEFRVDLEDPSEEYKQFIEEYCEGGDYDWDSGIAP